MEPRLDGEPSEGLTTSGTIRTGVSARHVSPLYLPIVQSVVERASAADDADVSVYLYGSVAAGTAQPPRSDVDFLTVGLDPEVAARVGESLSDEFADRCRSVEIAAAMPGDFEGDGDEPYGGRIFLHHYCVHLSGPDADRATNDFPGDRRAARGFNGDIAQQARRWRAQLDSAVDVSALGRRVARKTLFAVTGLVSIHDRTWTTDKDFAARRWGEIDPELAPRLGQLLKWSDGRVAPNRAALAEHLETTVGVITQQFADQIGLWPDAA